MIAGPWPTIDAFERWWKANVVAFNKLAVMDPEEWERIAKKIEAFQQWRKKTELVE